MAQHIRIRREQFADEVATLWDKFLEDVRNAALDNNLDANEAAEELEYFTTLREAFEIRSARTAQAAALRGTWKR